LFAPCYQKSQKSAAEISDKCSEAIA